MMLVGSNLRVSIVERAVTPKPRGTLLMLRTTTPACSGVSSVMRPRCALTTWLPYRNGSSPLGLIHTCSDGKALLAEDQKTG